MMTKNTKNPAHNLRITKYNIAITKLHASEPAMAHLVTYKSDIQVESRSTLKNDQLISLADESLEFSPFIICNGIYSLVSPV